MGKASIEQAYYVSLVIIALFVLKLLFGTLWNLTFGNIFNNHVVVHHKEHLDQMY